MASTSRLTHYGIYAKRGQEATAAISILPDFGGVSVHDGLGSHQRYVACRHALCNVHYLRELRFVEEEYQLGCAANMKALLCEMKAATEQARALQHTHLPPAQRADFIVDYQALLTGGLAANPPPPDRQRRLGQRGRLAQSPARNLLERLTLQQDLVLAFLDDLAIPFDNTYSNLRIDRQGMDDAGQTDMRAYSTDLRERLVRVVAEGQPMREAARRFGVSVSAVKRYVLRQQETGSLERKAIPGRPRAIGREHEALLRTRLEAAPDATVLEQCAWWAEQQGQELSEATMWRALHRLGWTQKKDTGSQRARRTGACGLARGRRPTRPRAVRLCRRKGHEYLLDTALRLGPAGATGNRIGTTPPRQEHDARGGARPRWLARALDA
jgi:transposase